MNDDAEALAYPRPLLRRKRWTSLNGTWSFALDTDATWTDPASVIWNERIEVPFAPETKRSGVHNTGLYSAVWYQRELLARDIPDGERLMVQAVLLAVLDAQLLGESARRLDVARQAARHRRGPFVSLRRLRFIWSAA